MSLVKVRAESEHESRVELGAAVAGLAAVEDETAEPGTPGERGALVARIPESSVMGHGTSSGSTSGGE